MRKPLLLVIILQEALAFLSLDPVSSSRVGIDSLRGQSWFQPRATSMRDGESESSGDNKAMAFLKKIGKVGGAANRDYRHAIGVDEGSSGKSVGSGYGLKKVAAAFKSCVETGIVDDMSEPFPATSSGTRWSGFTDTVMGGISMANLAREEFAGRVSNVLRGTVSLANNGGFIQMATYLAPGSGEMKPLPVDASRYEGVELEVQVVNDEGKAEQFNVQ